MRRLALLVAFLSATAFADDREKRISVIGDAALIALDAGGVGASTLATGARLRFAYGITHQFDLGTSLGFAARNGVQFPSAQVDGAHGNLFFDVSTPELSVDARWTWGIGISKSFWQTHPLLGVRAGVQGEWLRNGILCDETKPTGECVGVPPNPPDEFHTIPFVGAEIGVEHRIGTSWMVGLVGSGTVGTDEHRSMGVQLEVTRLWYSGADKTSHPRMSGHD